MNLSEDLYITSEPYSNDSRSSGRLQLLLFHVTLVILHFCFSHACLPFRLLLYLPKTGWDVMEWHEGENALRSLLRVPAHENPKSPGLSLYAARLLLKSSPLLAIGTLDRDGWPWTTILTSTDPETSGPAQPMRGGGVGVSVVLGERNEQDDPVVEILRQSSLSKSTMRNVPSIGGLGISLEERERIKISGKLLGTEIIDEGASRQLRMGIFVEWSLGTHIS